MMDEHEIDAAIAENLERGVLREVAPGRFEVTELGALVVEGMLVRNKCPKLFALLVAVAASDERGDVFSASVAQLRKVMSQLIDSELSAPT